MDDPQGLVPQAMGLGQIFLHRSLDIFGGNAMQVKHIRDGDLHRSEAEWFAKGLVRHGRFIVWSCLNGTP